MHILGFKTYTIAGEFRSPDINLISPPKHIRTTVCTRTQHLLTLKPDKNQNLIFKYIRTPQSYSCIYDVTCKIETQTVVETKTQSSCLLLNLTRPNHLVSYSTLQDPIILSLTQPYKTRSSCLKLTRPDHLVCDLIDQHAIMLIVNMLEQSI